MKVLEKRDFLSFRDLGNAGFSHKIHINPVINILGEKFIR